MVTDKSEIVNKLKSFYTNIGSNLANNIKYKGTRGHTYYLNKIVDNNFTFKYIEEDVIKRTIINLSNTSSLLESLINKKRLKISEWLKVSLNAGNIQTLTLKIDNIDIE